MACVLAALARATGGGAANLRVVTGLENGLETAAAALARREGYALHVLAASMTDAALQAAPDRVAVIAPNDSAAASDDAAEAANDARLAIADAVVLLWDGHAVGHGRASRLRLVAQAIRQRTPVIWIDTCADQGGKVRVVDAAGLGDVDMELLGVDAAGLQRLGTVFTAVEGDVGTELGRLVAHTWDHPEMGRLVELLDQQLDPGTKRNLHGFAHSLFLFLVAVPWHALLAWLPRFRKPSLFKVKGFSAVASWPPPPAYVEASALPAATWDWYARLDRAASHAANQHRDKLLLLHVCSFLAVFAAVGGVVLLEQLGPQVWSFVELAALLGILGIVVLHWKQRRSSLTSRDAWLHFRQATEAIRYGAILQPLLASLSPLHAKVWRRSAADGTDRLARPYAWLVIQLLREAGIPDQGHQPGLAQRAPALRQGLLALVKDQIDYNHKTHERSHVAHHRLHLVLLWVFVLVFAVVAAHVAHWIPEHHGWLLITAGCPALAAALHGFTTKLELSRVTKSSHHMLERLKGFDRFIRTQRELSPLALRALALQVSVTLYAEHDAWAELMSEQDVEVPA